MDSETVSASILVVEDEPNILDLMVRILIRRGYECEGVDRGEKALELIDSKNYDLIVTDIRMPGLDGISLADKIREREGFLPVVIVTGVIELEIVISALRVGVVDYITKPINTKQFDESIKKAVLHGKRMRKMIAAPVAAGMGEGDMELSSETQKFIATASVFVDAVESRTEHFNDHSKRVGNICMKVCKSMGMPRTERQDIYIAALLHDLGNIMVDDSIIKKPEELSDSEKQEVRNHVGFSTELISKLDRGQEVIDIITHHHERHDGFGYPDHLKGEDVPFGSRLISVADAYVAMTSPRPFRESMGHEKSLEELRYQAGHHFDPKVVEGFVRVIQEGD